MQQGLYFLFTTKGNVSSALFTQLLVRLTEILKDYCGVLSEESIRKNFILIYEILDEVIVCSFMSILIVGLWLPTEQLY